MKALIALILAFYSFFTVSIPVKKPEKFVASDKLVIGLDDAFVPMGFRKADGSFAGFDIDLARAVAQEMGIGIEFRSISWNAKEMELNGGNIDMIWSGMSKTPQRQENMTLSRPYLDNSIVIMTLASKPIAKKEDLSGKKIGTQAASAALECIRADAIYDDIADRLAEYETYDEAIMDLDTGRLDAVLIDKVTGMYRANIKQGAYSFGEDEFGEDFYVIGMRKGDNELANKVNKALDAVIKSGKAAEISVKWFGEDLLLR